MTPTKCPCCEGYGSRARPAHLPGEGPLACVSCSGTGLVWRLDIAPLPLPTLAPGSLPWDPWVAVPMRPLPAPTAPPLPTVTWTVRPHAQRLAFDAGGRL